MRFSEEDRMCRTVEVKVLVVERLWKYDSGKRWVMGQTFAVLRHRTAWCDVILHDYLLVTTVWCLRDLFIITANSACNFCLLYTSRCV